MGRLDLALHGQPSSLDARQWESRDGRNYGSGWIEPSTVTPLIPTAPWPKF
ncbi:hypothetical protein HZS61_016880 [Fusarium oxysporum f. sp. conglutinans]|uniref:Uncharacterized protein n=1 Tax=Fusarium oxysporum f. sp. conglutinans TaxID=100902 RepID=A0A8H6GLQ2_FUSOX|nr:hypothetical protein HZS61_016880 [Fusarium oxysporum f. sp. conglutinans]